MEITYTDEKTAEQKSIFLFNDTENGPVTVCFGGERIELSKDYGPLVAYALQIELDIKTAEWVIWMERYRTDEEGNDNPYWIEMARFDCQPPIEPATSSTDPPSPSPPPSAAR